MTDAMWADEALSTWKQDDLDRLPYAKKAAELIASTHSFESSAVFGLSGPWGSGKTSLVNLIVEQLRDAHPEWAVAQFTPWATSDVASLLGEFYASLAQALPKEKRRHVKNALAVTASVAAPAAALIPYAGDSAAAAIKYARDAMTKATPWDKAFARASAEMKKLRIPILVVVDDIDRLHVDELMALLKVVRLLGRFDGVEYLLAYDDETLYRSLTVTSGVTENDGSAERFMEKIVQYPLFVPPLLAYQQTRRLNAGLQAISRPTDGSAASEARLSGMLDCFLALLRTPRAIDRYLAQLRHHIHLVPPEEIDDGDVQLLTLIRVSFPSLFNALPTYRHQLLTGNTGDLLVGGAKLEHKRFDPAPLLELVPVKHREVANEVLVALFPKTKAEGQFASNGTLSSQGVANEEYFDRYFAMGIPGHDISDRSVTDAVVTAAAGDDAALTALMLSADEDRRILILSKGTTETNQPTTDTGRLNLAFALGRIASKLPDRDGTFGAQDQTLVWFARQLLALDTNVRADDIRGPLSELKSDVLRIRAWRKVEGLHDRLFNRTAPSWYEPVNKELTEVAATGFLEHLVQGDDAPTEIGVGYKLHFALSNGRAAELKAAVAELLINKKIDIATLASRIVSVGTYGGADGYHLVTDFEQELFNALAPDEDDPWYELEPVADLNPKDLSWANRRKFAQGRARRPS